MSKKENGLRSTRKKPSIEQWEALYEVAGNMKKLAPWRALYETDILVLQLPGRKEPVYCSVLGQGGITFGIGIYPGHESFLRLNRIISQDAYQPELLALEQDCLMCHFGGREDIEAEDRAVMKELGLRFRGKNQWIYFRSMAPGQFPWYLDADQAVLLTAALQNLYMLCVCYMEGKLTADFEAGQTLTRWYDQEREVWFNGIIPMPAPKLNRALDLQDELLLARLKRKKKTTTRLELDSFYLPLPIQENKLSPPAGIHMVLLVDKDSGAVLNQSIDGPDVPALAAAPSVFVNHMEAYGRPAAVYVRSEWMGTLLRNTCKAVGVRLVENEGVPMLDNCLGELLGPLLMGGSSADDFF